MTRQEMRKKRLFARLLCGGKMWKNRRRGAREEENAKKIAGKRGKAAPRRSTSQKSLTIKTVAAHRTFLYNGTVKKNFAVRFSQEARKRPVFVSARTEYDTSEIRNCASVILKTPVLYRPVRKDSCTVPKTGRMVCQKEPFRSEPQSQNCWA